MYELRSRVRYSEVDSEGKLTITGLMNYLQDCCTMQAEDLGVGLPYLREHHMGWVVTSYQIKLLEELPAMGQEIVVKTWPYRFRGMIGCRNYTVETSDGKRIVEGDSLWILMDIQAGKPVRLTEKMIQAYEIFPQLEGEWDLRRKSHWDNLNLQERTRVTHSQVDTNYHMNNAKYIEVAEGFFGTKEQPKEIYVEYKKSALLQDEIACWTKIEPTVSVAALRDSAGEDYCLVEFQY